MVKILDKEGNWTWEGMVYDFSFFINQRPAAVCVSKSVKDFIQSGKLKRRPSGGERAGFLEEESEPRTKGIFLAEKRRKIIGLTFQLS
jgi:hypothetical protein